MNSLRVVRAAARLRAPSTRLIPQRRGYAEAVSDKIKLTLALPHQVRTSPMNRFIIVITDTKASEYIQIHRRVSFLRAIECSSTIAEQLAFRVQVNIPAESGEMGILANHVPSIEQLRPGLVEIVEESGGSKQFFRTSKTIFHDDKASKPLPS